MLFIAKEKAHPPEFKNSDNLILLLRFRALGVPATDYVMEGRVPVSKVGGLSIPLDSPAKETLSLLHTNGYESLYIEVWPFAFFFLFSFLYAPCFSLP